MATTESSTAPAVSDKGASKDAQQHVPYSQQDRLPPWTLKDLRYTMGTYITLVHHVVPMRCDTAQCSAVRDGAVASCDVSHVAWCTTYYGVWCH